MSNLGYAIRLAKGDEIEIMDHECDISCMFYSDKQIHGMTEESAIQYCIDYYESRVQYYKTLLMEKYNGKKEEVEVSSSQTHEHI